MAGVCLLAAGPAVASAATPAWGITATSQPTNFAPGSTQQQYLIEVTNVGSGSTDGSAVTVTDTLPDGLTPAAGGNSSCAVSGQTVTCDLVTGVVEPGQVQDLAIAVDVASSASGTVTNPVSVSGGGAPTVSSSVQTAISSATPSFGLASFSAPAINQDGTPDTQAGSHPYSLTTDFAVTTTMTTGGQTDFFGDPSTITGDVRDIQVDPPLGLVGNPQATPMCTQEQFRNAACPASSQVGVAHVDLSSEGCPASSGCQAVGPHSEPVYNLVPPPGVPAEFAFDANFGGTAGGRVRLDARVRTGGDYGLTVAASGLPQVQAVLATSVTFWGVPADPSHDDQRCTFPTGAAAVCAGTPGTPEGPHPSTAPPMPFLTMPTACPGTPLQTSVKADSWQDPGNFANASTSQPAATGCDRLGFNPSIGVQPDTSVADSPSGLSVDLRVPQNDGPLPFVYPPGCSVQACDPVGVDYSPLATAELKKAVVTLPAGVSVDPSAGNGLQACTPAQIGINNANEPTCPDASKIGAVEVDTPLLPDPLKGSVYVAQQNQNPFGSLLAIYVTAEADGVLIKLAGHVVADPVTGQLQTVFDNNPQLPFTDFKLTFFGGPRGALATPESCGTFTTSTSLTPWSGTGDVAFSDPFTIDTGCVSGFAPSFMAGTQNPQAGAYSPFVLSFSRSDTDQELSGLTVKLPPGVTAKLAGVALCSDAQLAAAAANSGAAEAANPSCPANSQVGTVTTGSGPGPDPFFLGGKAYLTGPYKGAPYGMAVVVPALAGPYDLGTVVVRQALYIDPETAQVTAVSDPFPTILQGIPLRLRRVDVNLNRPGFTVNPTSCNPMSLGGVLSSTGGLTATFSPHFQVGGCQELGFSPRLAFKLTGKGQTHSGNHPTLTATLTQGAGQANIRSARVALPLSLALDPANSQHVCSYDVAQAVHGGAVGCPVSTIVGEATAVTPLLSQPLTGPVYLVQGIRFGKQGQRIRTLPTLLVPLRGQIALDLRASSSVNGAQQLVTTFSTIPDAPVSTFTLTINGGPSGLLVITGRGKSICTGPQVANANFGAQSGKTNSQNDTMSTPCGTPARLRVLSHRIRGRSLVLQVATSERGRLTVTGRGLRRFSHVLGAGTHTIQVALTRHARLKPGAHAAAVQVHVTLTPANAQGTTHTFRQRE